MTQIELARSGKVSREMMQVAEDEHLAAEFIRSGLSDGTIVIPKNKLHKLAKVCGIGAGLKTKINANIGTSKDSSSIPGEIVKMKAAVSLGADAIMDLSTGPKIIETRRKIILESKVPIGTVPIYEIVISGKDRFGEIKRHTHLNS